MTCPTMLALGLLIATGSADEPHPTTTNQWTVFGDEGLTKTYSALPGVEHNPDDKERDRLRVEWGTLTINKGSQGSSYLSVPGKLWLLPENGKDKSLVNWVQGVRIVLARTEKDRPDWSKRHDEKDSVWQNCVIWQDGQFEAGFSLTQVKRAIGEDKPFQIAVALGERNGATMTWKNTWPVLRKTVSVITIPGTPRLSKTLQLINACPSPLSWEHNPVPLVRAVNHLRVLGKAETIKALNEFLAIANVNGPLERDPERIDTSDQQCLRLLIPLLFSRGGPPTSTRITLEGDLPFHNVWIGFVTGTPPRSTDYLVKWADLSGEMRDAPLRPTNDPLAAADALYDKLRRDESAQPNRKIKVWSELRQHLCFQAFRAIGHLVEPPNAKKYGPHLEKPEYAIGSEKQWSEFKQQAALHKIRWDEEKQDYVADIPMPPKQPAK